MDDGTTYATIDPALLDWSMVKFAKAIDFKP